MARPTSGNRQTAIALPEEIELIRFEKNLLQIGFFSAHDRRSTTEDTSRRIEQWVNRNGKKIRVSAEFRSSLGLPSTADRDKYMAFMKIAMDKKRVEGVITNPIQFPGYALLKALGISDSGQNYDDLNDWGMRMADTTITSEQIIYSTTRKTFMNKTVHVFRSFTRTGSSNLDNSNQSVSFSVELEDWLLENLNQSYVVPEDFTQYRKLVRPTAKGIFVYLYVWFYASRGKAVEKDYGELCGLLHVRCYQHISKIKETMGLSLDDLVQIGYLQKWQIVPMLSKNGYKLVLTPGRAILDVIADTQKRQLGQGHESEETASLTSEQQAVKDSLLLHGISDDKAKSLCQNYDAERILDRLDFAAAEIARDGGRRLKNPTGFIISFIEGDQAIPVTYEKRSSRIAREIEAAELEAQRRVEETASMALFTFKERYEAWQIEQANTAIEANYSEAELAKRLKDIRTERSRDKTVAMQFNRVSAEQLRGMLMHLFRKAVIAELDLPDFESWLEINGQGTLFAN